MHISKYLLGFFLLVQGICLCPGPKNPDSKTVERKERLKNKVYKLKSSASDNGVIYYSNLQAPTWVRVELSETSKNILHAAAGLVKDAKYPAYQLPRNLSYDGVLIQQKHSVKNSEHVEFKGYCRENEHLNELFGTNLPIE
jgi:hypothetical protein